MAQQKYQGNLSSASFPFASVMKGPSVIVPQRDQSSGPYRDFSGSTTQLGMNIAQLYYAENVFPTNEGYKSVAFNPLIPAAEGVVGRFFERFSVFDGLGNKAMIATTTSNQVYMLSEYTDGLWEEITLPDELVWLGGEITTGTVFGTVYFCLQGLGIFTLDIPTTTWTKTVVTGLADEAMVGICDSTSYLIAFNQTDLAWSSTEDPTDFTPSLITGAGGGTPDGLKGQIITCQEINKGFIIYTSVMTMVASYSGNLQYPWVFNPLANGSGIGSARDVQGGIDIANHAAWTAAGYMDVTQQYCTMKFPELTDFLASGIWELYDPETKAVTTQYTTVPFQVRLASVANRYTCISYGLAGHDTLTYTLVFDEVLKRWGKIKKAHVQVFELVADASGFGLTWEGTAPDEWEEMEGTWSQMTRFNNRTPKAKNTLAFLGVDGTVEYVDFTYAANNAPGVAIFGKFTLTRTSLSTLECVELETVDDSTLNFALTCLHTLNGKQVISPVTAPRNHGGLNGSGGGVRVYDCRVTGVNHSIAVEGAFNLNSYVLVLHQNGRR